MTRGKFRFVLLVSLNAVILQGIARQSKLNRLFESCRVRKKLLVWCRSGMLKAGILQIIEKPGFRHWVWCRLWREADDYDEGTATSQ